MLGHRMGSLFRRNAASMARKPAEPLVVVLGPTGTGKSDLAVELAARFRGEVINADAMQLYRGLPIITNKITAEEQRGVPHHLLGHISPDAPPWDVDVFKREATRLMGEIRGRGNVPILVGGTHYYVDPLLFSHVLLDEVQAEPGAPLPELEAPTEVLLEELRKCDPVMAERWHPNDRRKIQRSLEIFLRTGKPASRFYDEQRECRAAGASSAAAAQPWEKLLFWVHADKHVLRERLDARADAMLDAGLLSEVRELRDLWRDSAARGRPLDTSKGIWQAIGYKQFEPYLAALDGAGGDGGSDAAELAALRDRALEDMKTATRRYANYQTRWIRLKQMRRLRDEGPAALRSLYLVDSTDRARFHEAVVAPAARIAERFLAGEADLLPPPETLSERAREVLGAAAAAPPPDEAPVRRTCELCGTVLLTEQAWRRHIRGAAHRRAAKRRAKLAMVPLPAPAGDDGRDAADGASSSSPPPSPDLGSMF